MRWATVVGIVLFLFAPVRAETRLLRHPSYSNGQVAFSYFGSIWVADVNGANPRRLTANPARDILPRFSPDGKWIAFSSNRQGNNDVYVIPAEGGRPRQLTFHSAEDLVIGWTPDSRRIIFQSTRGNGVFPTVATLFEISVDGGMERPLDIDWGSWASYSPDGSKLAFTRHPGVWSRKHYRGSYSVDLWTADSGLHSFTRLSVPDYTGNCMWPMYGHDGRIYFVADILPDEKHIRPGSSQVMKSVSNLWSLSENGGDVRQVTHFNEGDLFFPSMSADGRTIVFEHDSLLWKLDLPDGAVARIPVEIHSDTKDNDTELRVFRSQADEFDLSPSGRRAAISVHGEIFTVATERGEEHRVTHTPWRESQPRWSPDGKWIAFLSDRTGREEIWIADELGHNPRKLTDVDCDKDSITWAPDSQSLLWTGSDHTLRRARLDDTKNDTLAYSSVDVIAEPKFSPDGKWIVYAKQDAYLRSRVCLKRVAGGPEFVLDSPDFLTAGGAKWTPDGKRLLLLGGVGAPAMSSLNSTDYQLYSVDLTRITKDPENGDVDTEAEARSAERTIRRRRESDGPATRPSVRIEWDGLERRVTQLTHLTAGSVLSVVPSPDGRTYALVAWGNGAPAIYTIAEDGSRLTRLVDSSWNEPQWGPDGHSLYFMQGDGLFTVTIPQNAGAAPAQAGPPEGVRRRGRRGLTPDAAPAAAASATPQRIDFTVRMEIDHAAERRQVFEEAWRVMRNRFYDPAMHGVDWNAAKTAYEPLLSDVDDADELHNVIMEMIGELNASHTGVSSRPADADTRVRTRYPGFDVQADPSGYYKVSHIYRKGPADHDYVRLKTGDFLLALNDQELTTRDNYWRVLNLVTGRRFEFRVNDRPSSDGAWTIFLDPLDARQQADLAYERWVDTRREMVRRLSDGEIGYLHIRAMDAPSLARFRRDFVDNLDKKALIIDERFNGGGGIDQELLEILNQRKKYEFWRGRDSVDVPRPDVAFFGPMAVLENERSASNAEMFPEGFRTLGLGKVIGVTTYGAVIGTDEYRLLDGSVIRTPGFGVFTAGGVSLENYGVRPDVEVDNGPADFLAGRDRQIEKAVQVLHSEMK